MRTILWKRHALLTVITLLIIYVSYFSNINFKQFALKPVAQCLQYDPMTNKYSSMKRKNMNIKNITSITYMGEKLSSSDDILLTSHSWLKRSVVKETKYEMMNLLKFFVNALQQAHISFVMSQGMLLGSYFFHDLIPWDDDLDIFVEIADINRLRAVFRSDEFRSKYGVHSFHESNGINMYSHEKIFEDIPMDNLHSCGQGIDPTIKCYHVGKIYPLNGKQAGGQAWKYPFLDFFFIHNNGTHVYNWEDWNVIEPIIIPKEDFYPFKQRPFNALWLPAPRDPLKFLKNHYHDFVCVQGSWDHQNERIMYIHKIFAEKAPCSILLDCYPHVKRRPYINYKGTVVKDKTIEDLVIGDSVIHSVLVDEPYMKPNVLRF